MDEGRQLGGDVVGNHMQPGRGIEVEVFGEAAPQPRRLGRGKAAVAVDRQAVAAAAHAVSTPSTGAASQLGFDHDPGADLETLGIVGGGDPAHDLMTEDQRIDDIEAVALPGLDVGAGDAGRLDRQPSSVDHGLDRQPIAGQVPGLDQKHGLGAVG